MENLAPQIKRQRLLLEGYFEITVTEEDIRAFFKAICLKLDLKPYGDPIIFSPEGLGSEENQGFDAFLPLIDSGISVYIWSEAKFFSLIIYTCKEFNEEKAMSCTKEFFKANRVEFMSF